MSNVVRFDPSGCELNGSVPDVYAKFVLLMSYRALEARLDQKNNTLAEWEKALVSLRVSNEALQARLAEAERRLASITALCGQEGCDGEPYDTFYKVATGEFDPHVRYPATADSADVCRHGERRGLPCALCDAAVIAEATGSTVTGGE